jgi:17beta-estradiol 17-dehydrogenase / very-long-chain 3-oxoacyl-CoA reductase
MEIRSYFHYIVYIYIIFIAIRVAWFLYKIFFRKQKDLLNTYGRDSWVMITGATDGIGKAYCEEFARLGFNIILVSRNIEKLKSVATEIKKRNSQIQTFEVAFDFDSHATFKEYEEAFGDLQAKLDISILVNNVGAFTEGNYIDLQPTELDQMINLNIKPQTYLTTIMLKGFCDRKQRSAIINMSSTIAIKPLVIMNYYGATKSFNDFLSRSLSHECRKNNVDILSVKPGFVGTGMNNQIADGYYVITPQLCVKGVLRDLGYEDETYGYWSHKIVGWAIEKSPTFIINMLYANKKVKRE